ncbi:MAG: 1-acyl-sn-glycerol-3-phosphate acyltransferase [Lutibacter sp.]|uniref:lysophospholipid acyltransferase family protein n=1 Tax=Lutibacter sp. TaxID=1925666 RepID=UPI00185277D0|nr:lysophospholipid acyltransferase family protein [Lutibacter sp.]MBT8318141.1 1-acyl-sn-glycerol-3-phosphate acyltransferase [Lutibacter sp.]NNJ59001.1 1-acyl-sn-glycerol-3-phosphate acyltransferase [Lutibacter sp.]
MKTILSYILSSIFYLFYGFLLLFFQTLQWLGFNIGNYKGHKKAVDFMNCTLTYLLYFLGTKITFINKYKIPENVPLIVVSNHQSMHDICPLACYFKNRHPKFVSKIELGKGIPAVSYNLTHGGSVLIDRKDSRQSLSAIKKFGKYIEDNKYTAVIFPEGTRSKDGTPKRFSENGLKMLTKFAPSAYVIPVTINNCWKINKKGMFPLGIGVNLTFEIHEAIKADSMEFVKLFEKVEQTIKNAVA